MDMAWEVSNECKSCAMHVFKIISSLDNMIRVQDFLFHEESYCNESSHGLQFTSV